MAYVNELWAPVRVWAVGGGGGPHLFGLNVTLMTGDDAYFSKASPFKILLPTENFDNLGHKVMLLTNLEPSQKWKIFVLTLVYPV